MSNEVLAAWGAFVRPSFDRGNGQEGVTRCVCAGQSISC